MTVYCGDLYNAGLSYGPLMWNLAIQGKNLRRVEEYAEECLHFSHKNQLAFSVGLAEAVLAGWVAPMKPDYQPVAMEETLTRWAESNYVAASGSYFALLGFAQHLQGDYAAAAESLAAVERYLHGLTDNVLKRLWYVFRILNRLRLRGDAAWPEIEAEIALLLQKVETWARFGPLLQPYPRGSNRDRRRQAHCYGEPGIYGNHSLHRGGLLGAVASHVEFRAARPEVLCGNVGQHQCDRPLAG